MSLKIEFDRDMLRPLIQPAVTEALDRMEAERAKLSDTDSLVEDGEMSRYELAKLSGVDASQLCRFVHGRGEMTFRTLDRVGEVLGLSFVQEVRES